MALPRKPWYRADRATWYVEVDGKQVPLGPHPHAFPTLQKSRRGWKPPPPIPRSGGSIRRASTRNGLHAVRP